MNEEGKNIGKNNKIWHKFLGCKLIITKLSSVLNMDKDEIPPFVDILECRTGQFPIKYLGVPLHHDKLRSEDVQPLLDKILKGIAGWREKLLNYKGRLVLIKSCLASIPIYPLSF